MKEAGEIVIICMPVLMVIKINFSSVFPVTAETRKSEIRQLFSV